MDNTSKISELKERLKGIEPLADEPDFFSLDETIARFLKSRDWNVNDAEKMIRESIEYRRVVRPSLLDCKWCHENPGCHSMRQVGFDEAGRPVIYSSFVQANVRHNAVEDSVCHCTYLIENAQKTMKPGVSTWVFVIDCTGMTIQACNPKLGYGVTQVMSNHYPERLGQVVCVNHNPIFQGIWKAMKVFIHPNTASKVRLVKSKSRVKQTFMELFPTELADWLLEEIKLNKMHHIPKTQKEFWKKPPEGVTHDPRGCQSYVEKYVATLGTEGSANYHRPHPNVIESEKGKLKSMESPVGHHDKHSVSNDKHVHDSSNSDSDDDFEQIEVIDIPDEYSIPENAIKFT